MGDLQTSKICESPTFSVHSPEHTMEKIIKHLRPHLRILLQNFMPRWIIFIIDLAIVALSFIAIWYFRETIAEHRSLHFGYKLLAILLFYSISALIFQTHRGVVRYSTVQDLKRVSASSLLASSLFLGGTLFINLTSFWDAQIPNCNVWLPIVLCFVIIAGQLMLRFIVKSIFEIFEGALMGKKRRVFILGTDSDAIKLATQTLGEKTNPYKPVAFITLEENRAGKYVSGLPILYANGSITELMEQYNVGTLLINRSELQVIRNEFYEKCIVEGLELLVVNSFSRYTNGDNGNGEQIIPAQIDKIKIEDLLGRNTIEMNRSAIEYQFTDQVILITGAAGSIGSEICRQIIQFKCKKLVLVDQAETPLNDLWLELNSKGTGIEIKPIVANVSNEVRMRQIFECAKPSLVFHAAAYKHVPMMEFHPSTAVVTNVLGTKICADLSIEFGVKRFVMVSTDKAVNPTNVMGASKRAAEIYIQSLYHQMVKDDVENPTSFVTTRFGNVLGSNGSVVPLFKRQIESGGPITITHNDITRFFMTIPEACSLVLEAGCTGHGGEIYVFDMGEQVKIYDLAEKMIRLSGKVPGRDIKIVDIGLRPGEKLFEEVLNKEEDTLPTYHKKVLIAKVRPYAYGFVKPSIDELIEIALLYTQPREVVIRLKLLIPEFVSQNSEYCELDKILIDNYYREN